MSVTEPAPSSFSGRITEGVARMVPRPAVYARRQRESLIIGLLALAAVPLFVHGAYGYDVANKAMIMALLAMGFYIQFAIAGQFSLGTAAFYAFGAYSAVWAGEKHGGFLVGVVVGAAVAGALGMVVKLALSRSPLLQFAIASLSFAALSDIVLRNWESFTGGGAGKTGISFASIFGKEFKTPTEIYFFSGGVAFVGVILLVLLERSAAQRDWVFVKNMTQVARVSGMRTNWSQVVAFGVGAGYMGAAGAVTAYSRHFLDMSTFNAGVSLDVLLMVLIGGTASVWGPAVGAVMVVLLPEWLRRVQNYKDLVYAGLILVVILAIPQGVTSLPRRLLSFINTRRTKAASPVAARSEAS